MRPFAYSRAATLDDALQAVREPGTAVLAGGTELLNWLRLGIAAPDRVLDITHVSAGIYVFVHRSNPKLNVRELRRTLLAAIDLAGAEESATVLVGPQHLPAALERAPAPRTATPLSDEDHELRARLVTLLARHRGNVAAVARDLGKPRTGVQRLMARLGVQRPTD